MEFKYKTSFSSVLKPIISEEKDKYLSLASAEKLKSIIPDSVKGDRNIDFLPFAASLCNVSKANRNGDLVGSETALASYKNFLLRPINTRHRRDTTTGVIVNTALCKFESEEIITEEEAKDLKVYNVAIAGVIYKIVNSELADLVEECSDPDSPKYGTLSLSWEVGFHEYDILVGSQYVSEGEVISSDSAEFENYDKMLTANGGNGKDDKGRSVFRKIKGEIFPLGAGIVEDPAGYVKGIFAENDKPDLEFSHKEGDEDCLCSECKKEKSEKTSDAEIKNNIKIDIQNEIIEIFKEESAKKMNVIQNNASTDNILNKNCVTINKTNMKITKIEDITDENLKEATAADLTKVFHDQLKIALENSEALIKVKENAVSDAQNAISNLNKSVETLQAESATLKSELETFRKQEQARAATEKFNSRMAELDANYNLSDAAREIVGKKASTLNDEDYKAFSEEFAVFNKASIKIKESTASEKVDSAKLGADTVTAAANNPTTVVIPNATNINQDFASQFKNIFTIKTK